MWRLFLKDKATWKELNEYYTVEDVEKMCAVLEISSELEHIYTEAAKEGHDV